MHRFLRFLGLEKKKWYPCSECQITAVPVKGIACAACVRELLEEWDARHADDSKEGNSCHKKLH